MLIIPDGVINFGGQKMDGTHERLCGARARLQRVTSFYKNNFRLQKILVVQGRAGVG